MRCFFWLLFLPGVLCTTNPLSINPETLSAWDGSCIVIPCSIQKTVERNLRLKIISLIWYFDPVYYTTSEEYNGTMLFSASVPGNHKDTTSPNFAGRVRFVGNLEQRNCSLKISQLRKNDSGIYLPRLYGLREHKTKIDKWKIEVPVKVMGTPPKPTISSQEVVALKSTKVSCSVPYHCPDEPLQLTLSGLEARDGRPVASREANEIGKIQTTLTFVPILEDHGKTLRCSLSRQDGSEISQNSLLLNVNHAPQGPTIIATPGTTIQVGQKLSLECTIESSYPVAEYQWYKNSAKRSQWAGSGSKIEFDPIKEGDAGTYKCNVSNKVGYTEKQQTIVVQYLPKDTRVTVAPQVIHEGTGVVLRCSSRGNPPVDRYKWYKGLTQFSQYGTGSKLLFAAIQSGDSGTYYCVAHNQLGNSSSPPVVLDVRYPPKNVKLTNQSPLPIKEGNSVVLNCSVGSSNPPVNRYKWSKNVRGDTVEGSLLIFSATHRDVGPYSCEACNSVQCIASTSIHVDVLYGPKDVSVTQEPRGRILEGSQVRLNCNVGLANPMDITFVWYKDDLQLSSAGATWTISKAVPDDSGTYSCEARNSVGKSQSSTVTLDVLYGPRNVYVSLSPSETVTEGTDLRMLCKSDANPVATSHDWSWNEEWMPSESSRILTLPKVQVRHSGAYRCRAKNPVSIGESEPLHLAVSLSRATVLKRTLIGLGIAFALLVFSALVVFGLRNCKKEIDPSTGQTRRASFFVKKAKGENLCRNRTNDVPPVPSLGFLNQGAEAHIPYATIMLPPSHSEDRTEYACIKGARLAMAPAEDTVIYSAVKKPRLPAKGDTKNDYENVEKNHEEEIHYSSLMNLARLPCPTYRDSDADSESEESIQYASLKH